MDATVSTKPINKHVLMSDAVNFDVVDLNSYSHDPVQVNREAAMRDHHAIRMALTDAGIHITQVMSPEGCQDGIFTANWGLCVGDKAFLSTLPGPRKAEETYAREVLDAIGKQIIEVPYRFSGQGDALICGDYLFLGSGYRTDLEAHQFLADHIDLQIVSVQTVPELDPAGQPVINKTSGWADSFFYDIDLAMAIVRPDLIAWCPEAFTAESQQKIRALPLHKIEVSLQEATQAFACNLVSTGETVIMSANAPQLQAAIEAQGLRTITPAVTELPKGGGYIRCTTLTID